MSDGWTLMPPEQPRVCCVCGKLILISKQNVRFKTFPPLRSWHTACSTGQTPRREAA